MNKINSVQEIERILDLALDFKRQNPDYNYLQMALRSSTFRADASAATPAAFMSSAEYSYAIARLLFQLHMPWYAHFCAQQTVENYLKAYLKSRGVEPRLTHSLDELLEDCRAAQPACVFVDGAHIEGVILKFDAFNELPRYPFQRRGPESPMWVSVHPDDMHILDYFVFQVRKEIPVQPGIGSLFTTGHVHLAYFQSRRPQIYSLITSENINFGS